MKKICMLIFFAGLIFISLGKSNAAIKGSEPIEFTIFGINRDAIIVNDQCNNDSAEQDVDMDKDKNGIKIIKWEWSNKRKSWCGWQIEDLPIANLKGYEEKDYKLEIQLRGSWSEKAPQIKFIDIDNKASKLIRITKYMDGNPLKEKAVVTIPIKKFKMSKRLSIENIKFIQFDAAYESVTGLVRIYSIKVIQ